METVVVRHGDQVWQGTSLIKENGVIEVYVGTMDAPVLHKLNWSSSYKEKVGRSFLENAIAKLTRSSEEADLALERVTPNEDKRAYVDDEDVREVDLESKEVGEMQLQDVYQADLGLEVLGSQPLGFTHPNLGSAAYKSLSACLIGLISSHNSGGHRANPVLFRLLSLYENGPLFSALVETPGGILRYLGTLTSLERGVEEFHWGGYLRVRANEFEKETSEVMLGAHDRVPNLYTEIYPRLDSKSHGRSGRCLYQDASRMEELQKEIFEYNKRIPENCIKVYEGSSCVELRLSSHEYEQEAREDRVMADLQILKSETTQGQPVYTLRYTTDKANMKWSVLTRPSSICWNDHLYVPDASVEALNALCACHIGRVMQSPWQTDLVWMVKKEDESALDASLRRFQFNILKSIVNHPNVLKSSMVAFAAPARRHRGAEALCVATHVGKTTRVYRLLLEHPSRKGEGSLKPVEFKEVSDLKWRADDPAKDEEVNRLVGLANVLKEL